jgi:hypothetical protein
MYVFTGHFAVGLAAKTSLSANISGRLNGGSAIARTDEAGGSGWNLRRAATRSLTGNETRAKEM